MVKSFNTSNFTYIRRKVCENNVNIFMILHAYLGLSELRKLTCIGMLYDKWESFLSRTICFSHSKGDTSRATCQKSVFNHAEWVTWKRQPSFLGPQFPHLFFLLVTGVWKERATAKKLTDRYGLKSSGEDTIGRWRVAFRL